MLEVEIVTDLEGFKALSEDWNRIAFEANLSIFQTWEWSWHWWRANSRGKKLWLIIARDGQELAGVAPLYISSSYYGLPVKVAAFVGTNGTDYLDLVVGHKIHDASEIAAALTDELLKYPRWDAADLHQLPSGSIASGIIGSRAASAGLFFEQVPQDNCYTLVLPDSWDGYLAALSKKFRWNVQYYARRLSRDYEPSIRLSGGEDAAKDMSLFLKLHQKRFISKKKPGAYLSPKFRKFHTDLAVALAKRGWLRLYIMEIDKKPVAALYGFQFGDTFYYYLGGFEPDWGSLSVSTVLIARAIEDSIKDGLRNFNFLRGNEPYKQKWLAQESFNQRLIISRPGKKSGLVQKVMAIEHDLTKRVKNKLE